MKYTFIYNNTIKILGKIRKTVYDISMFELLWEAAFSSLSGEIFCSSDFFFF